MPNTFQHRLQLVDTPSIRPHLQSIIRGLEKEGLRITPRGGLAQTPHPAGLGSALCNPYLTTDYSEALLEFITPPLSDISTSLDFLDELHRFTYARLDDELLWAASMPCILRGDDAIPVAQYGHSNIGKMKTVYRLGLGHRYGRAMQTISGIHYNFSLQNTFWQGYADALGDTQPLAKFKNQQYLALIRNFRRYSWLLVYLFGASPALCKSFLSNQAHDLDVFDKGTVYRPYATALRMGKLGYQSSAQEGIVASYETLEEYISSLKKLLHHDYPPYQRLGTHSADGEWQQLSTALLQIENEFYSSIRPKQPIRSGEAPILALEKRGIEYVEVRALDVNPYLPLGVDDAQLRLLDLFLLHCLLEPSPPLRDADYLESQANLAKIVDSGRSPGLTLQQNGQPVAMQTWAGTMLARFESIATLMDSNLPGQPHRDSVRQQQRKLEDPRLTPSGRIMEDLAQQEISWYHFAMEQSRVHRDSFLRHALEPERMDFFHRAAQQSLREQQQLDAEDAMPFEAFLSAYYRQYHDTGGQ